MLDNMQNKQDETEYRFPLLEFRDGIFLETHSFVIIGYFIIEYSCLSNRS